MQIAYCLSYVHREIFMTWGLQRTDNSDGGFCPSARLRRGLCPGELMSIPPYYQHQIDTTLTLA